ncbi:MFS transporter [Pseudonocardia hispaniensis]|uniref:MFS transporter n=1 Tax=Pseudonocardia hispaniensis TaxID=904933 RepID=A0ABW1J9G3_9PSEU
MPDLHTTSPVDPARDAPPYRWRWPALVAVLTAEIMDLLDATVVGIAAPSIETELGGGSTMIQWIAAGYTLAYAVGLITGGRLGDRYGRRRVFLLGLVGFVAMSALCGLAVSPAMLVTCRILQGLAGAVLIPQGFGIIKATFPPRELGAAFGAFGPAMGLAAVGGPILAGMLIGWDVGGAGWRTVFLINVPIGLACLALAWRVVPESRSDAALRLDPVGMLLVGVGLLAAVFPLVQGRELGWPWWTFALLAAAVPVLVLFGRHQAWHSRTGRSPLVDPALLRNRAFRGGLVVGLVFFAGMTGLALTIGLYLQIGLGYSPLRAGLTLAPWAFGVAAGAALSGAVLANRYGRAVIQAGSVVMAAGMLGLIVTLELAAEPVTGWQLAPALAGCGLGMGLVMAPFFDIVLAGVTLPMVGSASGVLNANQQLGASAGVAVLGTVFFQVAASGTATAGMQAVLWSAMGAVLAAGALAVLLPRRARPEA